jgi:folylpolyglutamate synthase/dihydropteroate synthase
VFGCLKDKDAAAMARILGPLAERVFLAPLPTPRARPTSELRRFWRGRDVREEPSAAEAVRRALAVRQTVLVAGSLYLVGEAMKVLGVKP